MRTEEQTIVNGSTVNFYIKIEKLAAEAQGVGNEAMNGETHLRKVAKGACHKISKAERRVLT